MTKLFYELMQVAVGQLDCLSRGPSPEEWHELYTTAQSQGVVGICYKGVERLFEFGLRAPQDTSIDWMSETEDIRMNNTTFDKRCAIIQKKLLERKIYTTILLGQGVARYYGEELQELRQPKGIDVYVDCGLEKAIKFVQQTGQKEVRHNHHQVWLDAWEDTPVCVLPQIAYSKNPWRKEIQQRWFRQNREQLFAEEGDLVVPSEDMNVVYVMQHLYEQFLYGRVDMQQLMDCFFILKKKAGHFGTYKNGMTVAKVLSSFGIGKFAQGVMWVMQEVFRLERSQIPVEPLELEGQFILNEVMTGRHLLQMVKHYPLQMIWNIF
jgi:hypothetical protein